jgi:hypothetical protein
VTPPGTNVVTPTLHGVARECQVDEGAIGKSGRVPPGGTAVRGDGDKGAAHSWSSASGHFDGLSHGVRRQDHQDEQSKEPP